MKNNINFEYYVPVNILFGNGKADTAGEAVKPYGKRALIVTGGSSAKKSGLYNRVKNQLNSSGIETVLFDKVSQNPLTTTANEGANLAKEEKCDVVVAVGGGSVMDCGKAIAFLAVNKGDINDYIFNILKSDNALPLVCIPTTCGTGSEGNGFAVLTNPETGDKKSLRCKAIIPKVSIVDPQCMMTMPKGVLAAVGFDALCHNIEAYVSRAAQPFSDALSLYAVKLLADNLAKVYNDPTDCEGWEKITLASTIGGMVIYTAGVTLAHGMEHPASGLKNIVHGKGLAAIMPVVADVSYKGSLKKYTDIANCFGFNAGESCGKAIRRLLRKIDMNIGLSDLGIDKSDVAWMAENCMKVSAGSIANNPVIFTQEEIEQLYLKAL